MHHWPLQSVEGRLQGGARARDDQRNPARLDALALRRGEVGCIRHLLAPLVETPRREFGDRRLKVRGRARRRQDWQPGAPVVVGLVVVAVVGLIRFSGLVD